MVSFVCLSPFYESLRRRLSWNSSSVPLKSPSDQRVPEFSRLRVGWARRPFEWFWPWSTRPAGFLGAWCAWNGTKHQTQTRCNLVSFRVWCWQERFTWGQWVSRYRWIGYTLARACRFAKANQLQLSAFHNYRFQVCRLSRNGIDMHRIDLCMAWSHVDTTWYRNVCCNFLHWFTLVLSLRPRLALAFGWRWFYLSNWPWLAKPRCLVCYGNSMAESHLLF